MAEENTAPLGLTTTLVTRKNLSFNLLVFQNKTVKANLGIYFSREKYAIIPMQVSLGYGKLLLGLYTGDVDGEIVRAIGLNFYTKEFRKTLIDDINSFLVEKVFYKLREERRLIGLYCYSVKSIGMCLGP